MVIGLCIDLSRNLFKKNNETHNGQWKKVSSGVNEIRGKTLGIVGYGRIGTQVSIMAEAMGMHVCYYDIEKKLPFGNVKSVSSLDELLSISDIVSLHVPATEFSRNLINSERLKLMKKTAYLINTSRGRVVNIEDLVFALDNEIIKGAALDVFPQEPSGNSAAFISPLQRFENVILTPHVAGATEEAQMKIGEFVSHKLISFITKGDTEGATNFPALALPPQENTIRILHIHKNIPGIMSQINSTLADKKISILGEYLRTTHEIGYVVFDIERHEEINIIQEEAEIIRQLKKIKGTINARILY